MRRSAMFRPRQLPDTRPCTREDVTAILSTLALRAGAARGEAMSTATMRLPPTMASEISRMVGAGRGSAGPSGNSTAVIRGVGTTAGLDQGQGTTGYDINEIPLSEVGYTISIPDIDHGRQPDPVAHGDVCRAYG
jgi:hypothetical protein